ncbi:MAG: hypothetical protein IPN00_15050 [Hydrogenophilales bacterium]|nr:hypothetical protein [Hydrogenophilales bacterium]
MGPQKKEKARPITLSGGEQQRLCTPAPSSAASAPVLADEPTANLDDAYAKDIMDMFRAFQRGGRHPCSSPPTTRT